METENLKINLGQVQRVVKIYTILFLSILLLSKCGIHKKDKGVDDIQTSVLRVFFQERYIKNMRPPRKIYINKDLIYDGLKSIKNRDLPQNRVKDPVHKYLKMEEWSFLLDPKIISSPEQNIIKTKSFHAKKYRSVRYKASEIMSPIIFSNDFTKAAVYYEYIGEVTASGAMLYLFEKQGDKWVLIARSDEGIS